MCSKITRWENWDYNWPGGDHRSASRIGAWAGKRVLSHCSSLLRMPNELAIDIETTGAPQMLCRRPGTAIRYDENSMEEDNDYYETAYWKVMIEKINSRKDLGDVVDGGINVLERADRILDDEDSPLRLKAAVLVALDAYLKRFKERSADHIIASFGVFEWAGIRSDPHVSSAFNGVIEEEKWQRIFSSENDDE